MPTLYDYAGRPIEIGKLTKEIGAPSISGVRSVWHESVATGLTPENLAVLISQVDDENDINDYLTLAEEMEMRDLHYSSVLGTRKNAIGGLDVMIEASTDEKRDVEIRDFIAEVVADDPFYNLVRDLLDALGKGFSVCEIMWDRSGSKWFPLKYKHRDPRFFQFDYDTREELRMRDESDVANGIALQPYKFVQHRPRIKTGLAIRGGLARLAVVAYMCKGYTLKDWMAFAEVFGMPLRIGKYDTAASAEQKAALLSAVASIGTDAAAIIPESMMIEFVESQKVTGGERLFEGLANFLDAQVSKGILGQVASTEGTPGRLGGEDEQTNVRADIKYSDARQLSSTLQRDLVKPLVDLNFGQMDRTQYPKIRVVIEEPEDLESFSKSLPAFIDRGLKIEASFVRDKFGAPEPEEGAEILMPKDLAGAPAQQEEATEREQREVRAELLRKVREGEALTPDQRLFLAASMAAETAQQKSTTVQSVICSKDRFKSVSDAKAWVTEHDFHAAKVDETESSYRFRQREPSEFVQGSFRTIRLTSGVSAVIGKLKVQTTAAEDDDEDEIDRLTTEALGDWRRIMDPVLKPILDLAKSSEDYEGFIKGLDGVLTEMDSSAFHQSVATETFKARGLGDGTDKI